MNTFDIVNIIGMTAYCMLAVTYLWVAQIPRTRKGPGWWATAILCIIFARASLYFLTDSIGDNNREYFYSLFIIGEKYLLITGALHFFREAINTLKHVILISIILILTSFSHFIINSLLLFSLAFTAYNLLAIGWLALLIYRYRSQYNVIAMKMVSFVLLLFVAHWSTYPWLRFDEPWAPFGFLIGNAFVLFTYFMLLTLVLINFQQRLVNAEKMALDMAYHDPLTGLTNTRYMEVLFEQAKVSAKRSRLLMAVIFIDLDNFKPINDNAGHEVGDKVLKLVATRLEENIRGSDICARIGGDEFAVITVNMDSEKNLKNIATNLSRAISEPMQIDNQTYQVGASIGISLYPTHGTSLEKLLKKADESMYSVKKRGKNNFQIYQ